MIVTAADYAQVLYDLTEADTDTSKARVGKVITKIVRAGQRRLLPLVVEELEYLIDQRDGRLTLTVTTVTKLGPEQQYQIKQAILSAYPAIKEVALIEKLDPRLIGGIRLTVGERIIDHSLKSKLDRLAETV